MSIQFHEPRAQPMTAATPYRLSANLDAPIRVGLLVNGFRDSENFLGWVQ